MANEAEVLTDEARHRWRVARTLGAGGQGEVKLLADGEHAAKIIFAPPAGRAELERRLRDVKRLNLDGLDIARPQRMLAPPTIGYVMRFLQDMVPLGSLQTQPGENLLGKWISAGGLRRRCRILAHGGEVLYELHARGYVYGDVSPSNIFVSDHIDHAEAWLIDPDNIAAASKALPLYTPGYGAPELIRGTSLPDFLTDAHAFAVLVYLFLTGRHPWVGDAVADGEPELEERARRGEFAWVDDPEDDSNRSSAGIPAPLVMTKRLQELSRQAFSEARSDRTRRPSVGDWVAALHEQADLCVDCTACGFSLRPTAERTCWACDAPLRPVVEFDLVPWSSDALGTDGGVRERIRSSRLSGPRRVRCIAGGKVIVTRRLAEFAVGKPGREPLLELSADPSGRSASVFLRGGAATIRWKTLLGEREQVLGEQAHKIKEGDAVLLGAKGAAHTLLRLQVD